MVPEIKDVSWPGWETVRILGRGSYGAVYEIQRDVFGELEKAALKVISIPQNQSEVDELYRDGYDEESIVKTFESHLKSIVNEYSLMRKMNGCSNIVHCDDVRYVPKGDGIGWDIYIKMELLTPLADALPQDIPEEMTVKVAKDMCRALEICSMHGVIHRDIKPQNMFFSPNGDYKLGDFGIAKTVERTMGGTKIGTFKYMAPEVYNNQPYGAAADIYSLGLVLYWMLNQRRLPFMPLPPAKLMAGMDGDAANRRLMGAPIPAPQNGSEELKRIVLKACAYSPRDRYTSASEMLHDLEELGRHPVAVPVAAPEIAQEQTLRIRPAEEKIVPQPPAEPNGTVRVRKPQETETPVYEDDDEEIPEYDLPNRAHKKRMTWILVIGIVGILAAVFLLTLEIIFIINRGKTEQKTTNPDQTASSVTNAQAEEKAKGKYKATCSIFVNDAKSSQGDNASIDISSAEITASQSRMEAYLTCVRMPSVQQSVRSKFPGEMFTVDAACVEGTEVIEITVYSDQEKNLVPICNEYAAVACGKIHSIIPGASTAIISYTSKVSLTGTVPAAKTRGKHQKSVNIYVNYELVDSITNSTITVPIPDSIINSCIYIIEAENIWNMVSRSSEESNFIIEASRVENTEQMEIIVSGDDPAVLEKCYAAVIEIVPDEISSIILGVSANVLDEDPPATNAIPEISLSDTIITMTYEWEQHSLYVVGDVLATELTWSSEDSSVATVDKIGTVQARGRGTTNIHVYYEGTWITSCRVVCDFPEPDDEPQNNTTDMSAYHFGSVYGALSPEGVDTYGTSMMIGDKVQFGLIHKSDRSKNIYFEWERTNPDDADQSVIVSDDGKTIERVAAPDVAGSYCVFKAFYNGKDYYLKVRYFAS